MSHTPPSPSSLGDPARSHVSVLLCEKYSSWSREDDLIPNLLGIDGCHWKTYRCFEGELPNLDECSLQQHLGYVITGSAKGAYETDGWILELSGWVQRYADKTSGMASPPKLVGLCFGAQIIGQSMGGSVGINQTKPTFTYGLESLSLSKEFLGLPFVQRALEESGGAVHRPGGAEESGGAVHRPGGAEESGSEVHRHGGAEESMRLCIYQCHGDAVNVLPGDAVLYASSASTHVEIFGLGDRMLAFQGHPEFTLRHMVDLLPKLVRGGAVSPSPPATAPHQRKELMGEPHRSVLSSIIRNFLNTTEEAPRVSSSAT